MSCHFESRVPSIEAKRVGQARNLHFELQISK